MSRINGEKARAAIARSRRTAQRAKDRARRAELMAAVAAKKTEAPAPAPKKAAAKAPKKAAAAE